jgi:hypothetical protein
VAGVAYNANDATQQSFLGALALGESGGFSNAPSLGYGGHDLSGYGTDQYGFPDWEGVGNTHAAGTYQFQPGTWDDVASQHGLNFQNAQDQNAGAWYLAQDTYARKTGGDLETDLNAGLFSKVQSALQSVWPSVTGNAASPQGLAGALGAGIGAPIAGASQAAPVNDAAPSNPFAVIENWFLRGGLILIGAIVVIVSLWWLLSNQGIIPSPKRLAKAVV